MWWTYRPAWACRPPGARLFDALASLGLLARDARDRYANTPETELYLDRRSTNYIGGALTLQTAEGYPAWGALTDALRTGRPQAARLGKGFAELYADQAALETFLNGNGWRSRSYALLQSLNMLLMTESGFDFSAADCIGWLRTAGFRQTRVEFLACEH